MVKKKGVALASRWASVTDVRTMLAQARTNRERQTRLLAEMEAQVSRRWTEVERTLGDLSPAERRRATDAAVSGRRGELRASSADGRKAIVKEAARLSADLASASVHYDGAVQVLMRQGLGSERRSRIHEQTSASGPAELASLAALAAATNDREMGAAVATRLAALPRRDRPLSPHELADALVGDEWREVRRAVMEAERLALEAVAADSGFERGRDDRNASVRLALMRRREEAVGEGREPDADDDETQTETDTEE